MKLVDKIQQAKSNKISDYSLIMSPTAEAIEKIADQYAIDFGEWIDSLTIDDMNGFSISELLEIFKKEKGL